MLARAVDGLGYVDGVVAQFLVLCKELSAVAGRVSGVKEAVLGAAFLRSRIRSMEYRGNNGRDGAGIFGTPPRYSEWKYRKLDYGVPKFQLQVQH